MVRGRPRVVGPAPRARHAVRRAARDPARNPAGADRRPARSAPRSDRRPDAEGPRGIRAPARMPGNDPALRRSAAMPRAIPAGSHGPIFDRWMTWVETGVPDAEVLAREIAAAVPAALFADVAMQMAFAEQDARNHSTGFPMPEAPNLVAAPEGEKD